MDEKMIEVLAGAMVYCQVNVCGLDMFRAPNFAKEVVAVLKEGGYEIEIRPTLHTPDVVDSGVSNDILPASEVSASEANSSPATTQVM